MKAPEKTPKPKETKKPRQTKKPRTDISDEDEEDDPADDGTEQENAPLNPPQQGEGNVPAGGVTQ